MITWKQFMEGRNDFNTVHAPHYSHNEFTPIVGPKSHIGTGNSFFKSIDLELNNKTLKVGQKFVWTANSSYYRTYGETIGTILNVGSQNVTWIMDGEQKKHLSPFKSMNPQNGKVKFV